MGEEVHYDRLAPVDPEGPPLAPREAYDVLEDGEYDYDGQFEND